MARVRGKGENLKEEKRLLSGPRCGWEGDIRAD